MEKFKDFDKGMSWNSKLFFLMAFLLIVFSYLTESSSSGFAVSAGSSLFVVLIIDYFNIISHRYPKLWENIKWISIIIIVALTLIGAFESL